MRGQKKEMGFMSNAAEDHGEEVSIPMPPAFWAAAAKAARANMLQPIEYCRCQLLAAVERDGAPVVQPKARRKT